MCEYSKLQIALEYLDAAIEEREIHKRYFAATNLAGVAEEILGKILRVLGEKDRRTDALDFLESLQTVVNRYLGRKATNRKDLSKLISKTKNGIKHMDNVSDQKAKLFYDIEEESIWHIQNAINNMDRLGLPHSELVKSFASKY